MMDGSTLLTVAMVVMMGGMVAGAAWAIVRRRRKRDDRPVGPKGANAEVAQVAGNVGGAGRLEFSVIGDAVNVAARVESAIRQTGDLVLIAVRTRELLTHSKIELVEWSGLALKGKTRPVVIYAPVRAAAPAGAEA